MARLLYSSSIVSLISFLLFVPSLALAQSGGFVPCDGVNPPCELCHLAVIIGRISRFVIITMMVVTFLLIGYTALQMASGNGAPDADGPIRKTVQSIMIGFIIILAGWIVVDTVVKLLVGQYSSIGLWNEIECTEGVVIEDE